MKKEEDVGCDNHRFSATCQFSPLQRMIDMLWRKQCSSEALASTMHQANGLNKRLSTTKHFDHLAYNSELLYYLFPFHTFSIKFLGKIHQTQKHLMLVKTRAGNLCLKDVTFSFFNHFT